MAFRSFDECPHCHGSRIKRNGWEHGHQRRYCLNCHKPFSSRGGEDWVNSKDPQAHGILNTVNTVCCQIRIIHLRVHPQNIQKYLDEYAMKADIYDESHARNTCAISTDRYSFPGKPSGDGTFRETGSSNFYPSQFFIYVFHFPFPSLSVFGQRKNSKSFFDLLFFVSFY